MGKHSDRILDFITFLELCREENKEAAVAEIDMDNKTQDILHDIELREQDQYGYIVRGLALKDIRQKRRQAKNTEEVTKPIVAWMNEHPQTMQDLKKLLQTTVKIEKRAANRQYQDRTKIIYGLPDEEA